MQISRRVFIQSASLMLLPLSRKHSTSKTLPTTAKPQARNVFSPFTSTQWDSLKGLSQVYKEIGR